MYGDEFEDPCVEPCGPCEGCWTNETKQAQAQRCFEGQEASEQCSTCNACWENGDADCEATCEPCWSGYDACDPCQDSCGECGACWDAVYPPEVDDAATAVLAKTKLVRRAGQQAQTFLAHVRKSPKSKKLRSKATRALKAFVRKHKHSHAQRVTPFVVAMTKSKHPKARASARKLLRGAHHKKHKKRRSAKRAALRFLAALKQMRHVKVAKALHTLTAHKQKKQKRTMSKKGPAHKVAKRSKAQVKLGERRMQRVLKRTGKHAKRSGKHA